MADSKWISGLRQEMPVVAAARHVLLIRLTAVSERIAQALDHADEDMEQVHQLRVSTRRGGAALRIFQGCLPAKAYDKVRKKLRKVRRAAGAARDWDVFLENLASRLGPAPTRQRPGLDLLLGIGHGQRMAAQAVLDEAMKNAALEFEELIPVTLAALREPEENEKPATLRDLAAPMLGDLLREFETAAGGDLENYEHLHRVRILGKRLRYAMEAFESCFEKAFREEYYPAVEEMQETLGLANDSHLAAGRLQAIRARIQAIHPEHWKRYRPGIDTLLKHHQENLPRQGEKFLQWWRAWQKSGAEAAFKRLLTVE